MGDEEPRLTTAPAVSSCEENEVLLIRVGDDPQAVAEAIGEVMGVTITDLEALADSVPMVLFKALGREKAQELRFRLQHAGATVVLKDPRRGPESG